MQTKQTTNVFQNAQFITYLKNINKKHGAGSIIVPGIIETNANQTTALDTGINSLNNITGINGFPCGKIVEIFGPESCGKTTLALTTLVAAQKNNLTCAFIDAEHALNLTYAEKLGVNVNSFIFCQPNSGEHAFEIIENLIASHEIDLIVIDSVAALVPKKELNGELDSSPLAAQARLMSTALRRIVGHLSKSNTTLVFINQLREKINNGYGFNETTPGGKALKFYASMRIDVRRKEFLKDKDLKVYGSNVQLSIVKNKFTLPYQKVVVQNIFGSGFDKFYEAFNYAVKNKIIKVNGSWYYFDKIKLGQGMNNTISYIKENPDIYTALLNNSST